MENCQSGAWAQDLSPWAKNTITIPHSHYILYTYIYNSELHVWSEALAHFVNSQTMYNSCSVRLHCTLWVFYFINFTHLWVTLLCNIIWTITIFASLIDLKCFLRNYKLIGLTCHSIFVGFCVYVSFVQYIGLITAVFIIPLVSSQSKSL